MSKSDSTSAALSQKMNGLLLITNTHKYSERILFGKRGTWIPTRVELSGFSTFYVYHNDNEKDCCGKHFLFAAWDPTFRSANVSINAKDTNVLKKIRVNFQPCVL